MAGQQVVLQRLSQAFDKNHCRCSSFAKEEFGIKLCQSEMQCLNRCFEATLKMPELRRAYQISVVPWKRREILFKILDLSGCQTNRDFIHKAYFSPYFCHKDYLEAMSLYFEKNLQLKREHQNALALLRKSE